MRKSVVLVITVGVALMVSLAVVAGCDSTQTTGTPGSVSQSTTAKRVTVKDVATNPASYDGQEIVTEGNYAVGYCSACFLLKDGVSALRVEATDEAPLPPESKLNSRMEVTGKIYIAQGSPNLVASKIVYK